VFKPFTKTVPAEWDKLIAINLVGTLHVLHAVLPGMAERKSGRIVNIASDAARVGSSGEVVYAACKGGSSPFPRRWRASKRAMNPCIDEDLQALAGQVRRFASGRVAPGFLERDRTRVLDRPPGRTGAQRARLEDVSAWA